MTTGDTVSEEEIVRKKIQPLKKPAAKKAVAKKAVAPEDAALQNYRAAQEKQVAENTTETPANMPSSFRALHKEQLVLAAQHFGTLDDGSEELIRADLEDAGVTWADYCVAFGLAVPEEVVTLDFPEPLDDWDEVEESEEEELPEVATSPEVPVLAANQKYLVKFVGQNPYFEYKKYKFTQDNPYAIMPARDAQEILDLPEFPPKFRQAFPKELQEYYS